MVNTDMCLLCCCARDGGIGCEVPLGGGVKCAPFPEAVGMSAPPCCWGRKGSCWTTGSGVHHPWGCGHDHSASDAGVGLAASGPQVHVRTIPRASGMSIWPPLLWWPGQQGQEISAPRAVGMRARPLLLQGECSHRAAVSCMPASTALVAVAARWGAARYVVHHWCRGAVEHHLPL